MQLFLINRKMIVEGTAAFWFRPEKALKFVAGQFGQFSLKNPSETDGKGNARTFSIASDPANDQIMIATRMRDSAFKRSLWAAPDDESVQFMGPIGNFTLKEDKDRPAVFLAGGIGITPVRSIAAQATREGMSQRLVVIYSNRTRASCAFHDDFSEWSRANPNLTYVPTLTAETPSGWKGELGAIDAQMLRRQVSNPFSANYYVVGPPGFVRAMRTILEETGVGKSQIRSEDFAGY